MDEDEALPNEKLASLIVERLSDNNLVPVQNLTDIEAKLASGRIKQDEWRLWIDLSSPKSEKETHNEKTSTEN